MSKVAVLIPCYNEELTIAKVVKDCKKYLPEAEIFVCDNNSTDKTAEKAKKDGAKVMFESRQGKGNAVRRMFADIDADVYVMIDGDGTYDIKAIPNLIKILQDEKSDMVVGVRKETEDACYRSGHRGGNKVLTKIVELILGYKLRDMLSGLRVFSKRFVKTFPAESKGFEIETELTIFALSRRLPIKEVDTDYFSRPEGSFSKLSTYKDGIRILRTIVFLVKEECPMVFFGTISLVLFLLSLILGVPVVVEFIKTGLVPKLPTALLASSLMICSFISFLMGIVLNSLAYVKKEISRANYLRY